MLREGGKLLWMENRVIVGEKTQAPKKSCQKF